MAEDNGFTTSQTLVVFRECHQNNHRIRPVRHRGNMTQENQVRSKDLMPHLEMGRQ